MRSVTNLSVHVMYWHSVCVCTCKYTRLNKDIFVCIIGIMEWKVEEGK